MSDTVEQPEIPPTVEEAQIIDAVISESALMAEAEADVAQHTKAQEDAPKADPTATAMLSIAKSMETMMSRAEAVRQIPFNEIKPVTPWNPEGKTNRVEFSRPTFQHGIALNPVSHTEKTIKLFNQLKPGRYIDRKVEVRLGSGGEIDVSWPGVRIDQRIEFYSRFPHIDSILEAIIEERKAKEAKKRAGNVEDNEIL